MLNNKLQQIGSQAIQYIHTRTHSHKTLHKLTAKNTSHKMKLLTFNGSLKQKENKPSVSTHKEKKKAENIFPHVKKGSTQGLY
jgi:hypothetical protein